MKSNKEINVGLILGGISGERPVSLETGKAVYDALLSLGFNVKLIDPALGKNQYEITEHYWGKIPTDLNKAKFYETFSPVVFEGIDVAFIALHGTFGEDGITQTLLDLLSVPFVGSDAFSSAIGINKYFTKIIGEKAGVKFPTGITVRKNDYEIQKIKDEISTFGKFVVKPNRQGSSLGLSVCNSTNELENAINKGFAVDDELIIEEFIEGRELTVAILHDKTLPLLEIVPDSGLYDYEAKYESDNTNYIVPANVNSEIGDKISSDGMKLFKALGCRDYARVDFKLTNNGEYFCLEINTLPGMTSHSLLPKAANAIGIDFNSLVEMLIKKRLQNE